MAVTEFIFRAVVEFENGGCGALKRMNPNR